MANGKLHCFLSHVTSIAVKWQNVERQKIFRIRIHLIKYFFPDENYNDELLELMQYTAFELERFKLLSNSLYNYVYSCFTCSSLIYTLQLLYLCDRVLKR